MLKNAIIINNMTKEEFIGDIENWDNHRILLYFALTLTKGKVIEYGSGKGSTPYLRQYCIDNMRLFETYDFNKEWAAQMNSFYVSDWDSICPNGSVILIDHSPGERRTIDIPRLADNFEILVIHDSEPAADGYDVRKHFKDFNYVVELKTTGAWTTALSNTIDITKWIGEKFGEYKISEWQR